MRYFLVTYSFNHRHGSTRGNIWFQKESFPSWYWLNKEAREDCITWEDSSFVIESLYEFKSIEDFEAFKQQEEV